MSTQRTSSGLLPLTAEQSENLSAWRAWAMTLMPYFSHIVFGFRPINAPGLGTFACDEHLRLYVDFDAVSEWGTEACAQALLHEAGHVWGLHSAFARDFGIGRAQQKVWNAGADMSINDDLAQAGCDFIAETGLMPSSIGEPDNQTAKHYFDALMAQVQQQQQQQGGGGQGGDEDGDQQDNNGGGEQDGDGQGQQDGPFSGCGSVSGGESAPCELDPEDDADGNAPAANSAQVETAVAATAASIIEHASRGRGTVPGNMVDQARGFLAPAKVPWRRVLSAQVRRAVRLKAGEEVADYTRRDRRRHQVTVGGKKVIFPGRAEPVVSLAVVRDTSGSMGPAELDRVTSEVVGIAKAMRISGDDLKVLDVDTQVHATRKFRGARSLAEIAGRGGTDMVAGIEAALDLRPRPAAVVVISDGGTGWPQQATRTPVIACLVGPWAQSTKDQVPSWIRTVVVED